jgi:mono/diheme cytochrome c family protein
MTFPERTMHLSTAARSIAIVGLTALYSSAALAQNFSVPRAGSPASVTSHAAAADEPITYTRHVAPIVQQKCQVCHQPGSIAPFSLLTYEDAIAKGEEIRARVSQRMMPPWGIDRTVGIHAFKNDRGLSDEQIATLVRWVDGGMQYGKKEELPPNPTFANPNDWQLAKELGPPDLVLESPPYTLAAHTQDKWFRPVTETIEIRPASAEGRKVVHHVLTQLEQTEDGGVMGLASSAHEAQMGAGLLMEWSIGKAGEIFPADAGKLLLPGSRIRWEVHMFAIGKEMPNQQVELALYFYPKGVVPKHRTVLRMFDASRGSDLDIPPNKMAMTQNFYVMPAPARIENFQPHMHMRGKMMSMEAVYPDGRREMLSSVNNFQWKWQGNYVYADSVAPLLPKGTMLVFTAWHDNTAANPNNPDPNQWVGWGDRTVDEMAHVWVDVTYLEQAEFDQLVAARKARTAAAATKSTSQTP